MNGAKSRVEKLCQAFENGKDLVELSDLSPHDISNVLKLYLRQVGLTHSAVHSISGSTPDPAPPTPLLLLLHYFVYSYQSHWSCIDTTTT